ncbi:unnamed protein product [Lymnaea stagnalis]|uniref:Mitochondrial fission process protein 1 n=1 Tax=Lymnaea stagnalis TaxID=6523 RepID=A0AAV2INQ7_LYMST
MCTVDDVPELASVLPQLPPRDELLSELSSADVPLKSPLFTLIELIASMSAGRYDPFSVFPLRALGYGYAVGVAIRYRFCKELQDSFKTVAITFVVCHALNKSLDYPCAYNGLLVATDTAIFETFATILLPTLTTFHVSGMLRAYLKQFKNIPKWIFRYAPIAISLGLLPVMLGPIDRFVNHIMDNTVRNIYTLPSMA